MQRSPPCDDPATSELLSVHALARAASIFWVLQARRIGPSSTNPENSHPGADISFATNLEYLVRPLTRYARHNGWRVCG